MPEVAARSFESPCRSNVVLERTTNEESGAPMQEFVAQPCTTETYYLGECARWDEVRHELSWVDVDAGAFIRATAEGPDVNIVRRYDLGAYATAVAPMEDRRDGWIVAVGQSIVALSESGDVTQLAEPEARNVGFVRMNDGSADPWGRFWIGSMAFDYEPGRASLYRWHESRGTDTILSDVTISNGIGWSPDERTMYYCDSAPGTISMFDVGATGEINKAKVFAQFDVSSEGAPDGLCVDSEGTVWVAVWGGYEVRRYAPSGEQIGRVRIETAQPSCCAIGGANGTTLYITTAREHMKPEQLDQEPNAGRLFCVDVGVSGQAINSYRRSLRTRV
jgi:sugar lactone lactonase YvrE